MNCGMPTDNADGVCDRCKGVQPEGVHTPRQVRAKLPLDKSVFKAAGFFLVVSLVCSFVLAALLSLILKASNADVMNLLAASMDSAEGLGNMGALFSPYAVWRLCFLNVYRISVSAMGYGISGSISIMNLIYLVIPFVSLLIAWVLYKNAKVRQALSFCLGDGYSTDDQRSVVLMAVTAVAYGVIFFLTSFIPMNLVSSDALGDLGSLAGAGAKLSFSAFPALLYTMLVVFVLGMLAAWLTGHFSMKKVVSRWPALRACLQVYKNYIVGVFAAALALFIVLIFKAGMPFGSYVSLFFYLPNLTGLLSNVLLLGGLGLSGSGQIGSALNLYEGSTNLLSMLLGDKAFYMTILSVLYILFLIWCMWRAFRRLDRRDPKQYWKHVGIATAGVLIIQAILVYVCGARVSLSMVGSISIGSGLWLPLLFVLVAAAIAALIAMYVPTLMMQPTANGWFEDRPGGRRLEWIIIAVLLVISLVFGFLMVPSSQGSSYPSGIGTAEGTLNLNDYPAQVSLYNGGYVFTDQSGDLYTYSNGRISPFPTDAYALDDYDELLFSNSTDLMLYRSYSGEMRVVDAGGTQVGQTITYDTAYPISATPDFSRILFVANGDLMLYDQGTGQFTSVSDQMDAQYQDIGHWQYIALSADGITAYWATEETVYRTDVNTGVTEDTGAKMAGTISVVGSQLILEQPDGTYTLTTNGAAFSLPEAGYFHANMEDYSYSPDTSTLIARFQGGEDYYVLNMADGTWTNLSMEIRYVRAGR